MVLGGRSSRWMNKKPVFEEIKEFQDRRKKERNRHFEVEECSGPREVTDGFVTSKKANNFFVRCKPILTIIPWLCVLFAVQQSPLNWIMDNRITTYCDQTTAQLDHG